MAVSVSYPGVYIQEFAPGAPIQGVGTSISAFVGVAAKGPIDTPTVVQSWDEFQATFGGFPTDPPVSYLATAVYGFFLNGGSTCYVLRAATARDASIPLPGRDAAASTLLTASALAEGPGGNSLSVTVGDSSLLADQLTEAGQGKTLAFALAQANVASLDAARRTIKVSATTGFRPGDPVALEKGGDKAAGTVATVVGNDTITLASPLPGAADFAGGTVRSADLASGVSRLRVIVPSGLLLPRLLPRGAQIAIRQDAATQYATVTAASGDVITFTPPLATTVKVSDAAKPVAVASLEFDLTVADSDSGATETFPGLAMDRSHPNYWGDAVASALVTLAEPDEPPAVSGDRRPKAGTFALAGGQVDDRGAAKAAVVNAPAHYLDMLRPFDDIAIVAVPGEADRGVQQAVISHCEDMLFRFGVLDSARGIGQPDPILAQADGLFSPGGYAALYYPWITVRNPVSGATESWPPSGHVAGIMARTDATEGVHVAPANTNIRGALGVERRLTDAQHGLLNLDGVNVTRVFPGEAVPLLMGARTLASNKLGDRNWQYVNIRRLFLYLEKSIHDGIRWAIFKPNNLSLWQQLRRTISEFLERVWRDGALFGATSKEAFYVRIDDALNPQSEQALGRLNIEIGVRPAYPAEFIVVRIGIWQGGASVTEG